MPVIVRELDDDEATIIMVDSNLQRKNILPSERAAAYQMKMEAIRRSAGRPSKENCDQLGHNFSGQRSIDIIAENAPDSRNQIQRFIRLNNLEKPLLQMVDDGKIAFTPAVELSYLKPKEQRLLLETMAAQQSTPSLSQAQRMKKLSQDGILTHGSMVEILSEVKKPPRQALTPGSTMEKPISNEQAFPAEQAQDTQFITLPINHGGQYGLFESNRRACPGRYGQPAAHDAYPGDLRLRGFDPLGKTDGTKPGCIGTGTP